MLYGDNGVQRVDTCGTGQWLFSHDDVTMHVGDSHGHSMNADLLNTVTWNDNNLVLEKIIFVL